MPSAGESLDLPLAGLCGVSLFHALEESQLQQSPSPSQSRPVFSETLPIGSVFSRRQALPAPGGSPPLSPGLLDLGLFRTERLRASRTSDFRIICRSFCRIKCRGFSRIICHTLQPYLVPFATGSPAWADWSNIDWSIRFKKYKARPF